VTILLLIVMPLCGTLWRMKRALLGDASYPERVEDGQSCGSVKAYTLVTFPRVRRAALDLAPSERRHLIHALLEVDVTRARGLLAEYKAETGEGLSFTAFIIHCLARAVDDQKSVQGHRQGRGS
jgi:hypothetical protein